MPPRARPAESSAEPPRRRRLAAAARRTSILEAAIPVFATLGYEQTRMSDIAMRVGVTEPVIFQNFGTKADLFAAALERVAEEAATYLNRLAAEHAGVLDWVGHLLADEHVDYLHTAPMFGVLFEDAHRLHAEPAIARALERSTAEVAGALAEILQRGQVQGSIRSDVPPLTLAWLVVSLMHARQFRRRFTPRPAKALEDDLLAHVLDVVRGDAATG